MKIILKTIIVVLTLGCLTSDLSAQENSLDVPNGIYLVEGIHKEMPEKSAHLIVPYSHDFLDPEAKGEPEFIEINTTQFVALDLAEEPKGIEQEDQRINLLLTLNNEASTQLADFTERHVGRHVAIVIGNQGVTRHKVRERIEGGKLQITRCTDNACKHLLLELRENYKN